jgi:hypothetical protein
MRLARASAAAVPPALWLTVLRRDVKSPLSISRKD